MASLPTLNPPGEFVFSGNLPENWVKWKQRFNLYINAVGIDETKDAGRLVSILLTCLGESGIEIFNTFKFDSAEDDKKYKAVIKKFDEYFLPKKNLTFLRHQFFTRKQAPGETIDQFVTDLKNKSKDCEFKDLADGLITDRIVCGILHAHIKERLLREHDLKLDRAIEICHAAELSTQQLHVLEGGKMESGVHSLRKSNHRPKSNHGQVQRQGYRPNTRPQGSSQNHGSSGKQEFKAHASGQYQAK